MYIKIENIEKVIYKFYFIKCILDLIKKKKKEESPKNKINRPKMNIFEYFF